jgi:hypothetical protein
MKISQNVFGLTVMLSGQFGLANASNYMFDSSCKDSKGTNLGIIYQELKLIIKLIDDLVREFLTNALGMAGAVIAAINNGNSLSSPAMAQTGTYLFGWAGRATAFGPSMFTFKLEVARDLTMFHLTGVFGSKDVLRFTKEVSKNEDLVYRGVVCDLPGAIFSPSNSTN